MYVEPVVAMERIHEKDALELLRQTASDHHVEVINSISTCKVLSTVEESIQ